MTQPTLKDSKLDFSQGVATLTFMRDDVRNAVSGTQLIDDLVKTIDWIEVESCVAVLIVTGQGKAFSAGGNLKEMRNEEGVFGGDSLQIMNNYHQQIQRIPRAFERCAVPVIAAVNGYALGVGLDMVCMCDLRLAADSAKMGEVFINLGLIPGDGGAFLLPRAVGWQRALELATTGRMFTAKEGLAYGLLMEVMPDEELMPRARQLAESIACKPAQTVRLTKKLFKTAQNASLQQVLDLSAAYNSMLHKTPEHEQLVDEMLKQLKKK